MESAEKLLWIPFAASFLLVVLLGPVMIPILRRFRFGQSIREEGPERHYKKSGTPTMGGLMILLAIIITLFPFSGYFFMQSGRSMINSDLFFLLFAVIGYGALGFMDDYIKVVMKRNLGLTAAQKFIGQLFIGLILFVVLLHVRTYEPGKYIFNVLVPWTNWSVQLNFLYLPFLLLIMTGSANATNLTDGLDGLLSGTAACAYSAYAIISVSIGNYTAAIFSLVMVGALSGFLIFNAHPAKVFMGDTGSLSLGAGIAALSVITNTELLLPIIGGVFVIETLSVILQVLSFRLRGKRIFRMSPIHHHFELMGWSEWRVVMTFWTTSLFLAAAGVLLKVGSYT